MPARTANYTGGLGFSVFFSVFFGGRLRKAYVLMAFCEPELLGSQGGRVMFGPFFGKKRSFSPTGGNLDIE